MMLVRGVGGAWGGSHRVRVMYEAAVAWAEKELARPVKRVRPLAGGLTSTMLELSDSAGASWVLRLMTNEPWRAHGPALTSRERDAQRELAATAIPVPSSIALDPEAEATGFPAHLMTLLPGKPAASVDDAAIMVMAGMLAAIHEVTPRTPFRPFESWAWEAKRVVPAWTRHPDSWQRAFDVLAGEQPDYREVFLHRDFSHRNLLWERGRLSGVVDWVETSMGPADLDAGHAASNLAITFGPAWAMRFLGAYGAVTGRVLDPYWLVMDSVGFLAPPGKRQMFGEAAELSGLDAWLHELVSMTR